MVEERNHYYTFFYIFIGYFSEIFGYYSFLLTVFIFQQVLFVFAVYKLSKYITENDIVSYIAIASCFFPFVTIAGGSSWEVFVSQ